MKYDIFTMASTVCAKISVFINSNIIVYFIYVYVTDKPKLNVVHKKEVKGNVLFLLRHLFLDFFLFLLDLFEIV